MIKKIRKPKKFLPKMTFIYRVTKIDGEPNINPNKDNFLWEGIEVVVKAVNLYAADRMLDSYAALIFEAEVIGIAMAGNMESVFATRPTRKYGM